MIHVSQSNPELFCIGNMLRYPLTHVISADYSSNWNSEAILELLEYFTPERMRIDFASKSVDGKGITKIYDMHIYILMMKVLLFVSSYCFRSQN